MFYFPEYHSEREEGDSSSIGEEDHSQTGEGDYSQVFPSFLERKEGTRVRNFPPVYKQNRKSRKIRCILPKQENYLGKSGRQVAGPEQTRIRLREKNPLAHK